MNTNKYIIHYFTMFLSIETKNPAKWRDEIFIILSLISMFTFYSIYQIILSRFYKMHLQSFQKLYIHIYRHL